MPAMKYIPGLGVVWMNESVIVAGPLKDIISPVTSLLGGILGGGAPKPPAPPPPPPPPTPIPTQNDAAIAAAKRRQAALVEAQSGRASTILSQGSGGTSDKLGG